MVVRLKVHTRSRVGATAEQCPSKYFSTHVSLRSVSTGLWLHPSRRACPSHALRLPAWASRRSSRPHVAASSRPRSQTPHGPEKYATAPEENSPPSAAHPSRTPPRAAPHRCAAPAAARTTPLHPVCV